MKDGQFGRVLFTETDFAYLSGDQEAIDRYQIARKKYTHLTLIGEGRGCALSLMLASRFMPDEIHLYPLKGASIEEFLKEVQRRVQFLYFVCAPIRLYVPCDAEPVVIKKMNRLLNRVSSFQKEIIYLEKPASVYEDLTNIVNPLKTLA